MQFDADIEKCLRNPFLVRELSIGRKLEVLKFLHDFRLAWHRCRSGFYSESRLWLSKRGKKEANYPYS